ncbi:MAG TPA: type II toxin-antitoxin system HicB family antitoxin [Longimicrobium sp.]|nr:type II toxin-antitoxin system HicB family antitoxin [Longimicrobium sp.]
MQIQLTAVYQKVQEGYIAWVQDIPGVNTQGDTLGEARENLREAVTLVLYANRALAAESLQGVDIIVEPLSIDLA